MTAASVDSTGINAKVSGIYRRKRRAPPLIGIFAAEATANQAGKEQMWERAATFIPRKICTGARLYSYIWTPSDNFSSFPVCSCVLRGQAGNLRFWRRKSGQAHNKKGSVVFPVVQGKLLKCLEKGDLFGQNRAKKENIQQNRQESTGMFGIQPCVFGVETKMCTVSNGILLC